MAAQHGLPDDFTTYWDAVDRELAGLPAAAELTPLAERSSEHYAVSGVRLTSVGPYRIFGYLSVPAGDGPFPGLLQTPRYGSVNHVPDYHDRRRYVVLTLMHRGQRLADTPFSAAYPGLLTVGIESPATYVYRGIVADCLRGAEFLLSRPEVDPGRVAIAGDDLALITAARRPGFTALQPSGLLFYRAMEAREQTRAYPLEELNDLLRAYPAQAEALARTLAYFDPLYHAPSVRAATLLSIGDGALDGPDWLAPLEGALGGPVEQYRLTHRGGTDHDHIDAWLAARLGSEPLTRFRRTLP